MNRFRILRIVLMIAAIFAAGIGIGYRLAPPPASPGQGLKITGTGGREVSADSIVAFYDKELSLDESQKTALRELARPFLNELTRTKPDTQQRFNVFKAYFPRVRALLREDQHAKFDDISRHFRERIKKMDK